MEFGPRRREVTVEVGDLWIHLRRGSELHRGFAKIDVEGAESLVLRGMRDILAEARPRMMIEVTNDPESVFEIFAGADYLLFDEKQRRLRQPDRSQKRDRIYLPSPPRIVRRCGK